MNSKPQVRSFPDPGLRLSTSEVCIQVRLMKGRSKLTLLMGEVLFYIRLLFVEKPLRWFHLEKLRRKLLGDERLKTMWVQELAGGVAYTVSYLPNDKAERQAGNVTQPKSSATKPPKTVNLKAGNQFAPASCSKNDGSIIPLVNLFKDSESRRKLVEKLLVPSSSSQKA